MSYFDHEHTAERQSDPCEYVLTRKNGTTYKCGASWTSALHPPDQYRHWCAALEAGGDCIHEEEAKS